MLKTQLTLHHWTQLYLAKGLGPRRLEALLSKASCITDIFRSHTLYQSLGIPQKILTALKAVSKQDIQALVDWNTTPNQHLLCPNDRTYPSLLKEISDPPLLLFVRGNVSLLQRPQLAIVGARQASHYGVESAKIFAHKLTQQGLIITSGLARGIDGAAHQGALMNNGPTIAVLGCGLNHCYPPQHQKLAHQIAEQGALLSEFAPEIGARALHFPQRNRIISGISLGTLVVEAAARSGSLITARQALEQNREVFAIPGNIHTKYARGCHELIQQGAKLITSCEDIICELPLQRPSDKIMDTNETLMNFSLAADQQKLVECVGFQSTSVDLVINRSGLTAPEVCSMLLELELLGIIKSVPGGYVRNLIIE